MSSKGQATGQKQSIILITEGNLPNVDVSRIFVDKGEHANILPWQHVYLHQKKRYWVNQYVAALANSGVIDFAVTTGAVYAAHMVWSAFAGGDMLMQIYNDTALDSDPGGSAIVPINRSQEAPIRASTASVIYTPGIDTIGSALIQGGGRFIPGGTTGAAQGGSGEGREEMIQPVSTTYIYRLTNISGQARKANLFLDFYEHEPIDV